MRPRHAFFAVALVLLSAPQFYATVPASFRGIVHDPTHRPIPGAQVTLRALASGCTQTAQSNADGEFQFDAVPVGDYEVSVSAPNFAPSRQQITVTSGKAPIFHFQLEIAGLKQTVEVSGAVSKLNTQSSTVQTAVSPQEIAQTPGAD